jgi:AcrR family transcriptional regulator
MTVVIVGMASMTVVMEATNSRERTVRSAALLFRERGVDSTGLRQVVEHAQAPRGSLQHHFPGGKQQLVVEAVEWIARKAAEPLEAILETTPPPDAQTVVAELFDRFRKLLTRTSYRAGCPIAAAVVDRGSAGDAVATATRHAFRQWATPLELALRRGGLSELRAARVSLLVISSVEGALIISRARHDMSALDAVAAEIDLLLTDTTN